MCCNRRRAKVIMSKASSSKDPALSAGKQGMTGMASGMAAFLGRPPPAPVVEPAVDATRDQYSAKMLYAAKML